MSTPLSTSNADLVTTSISYPSKLNSAGVALPNMSSLSNTQTSAENVVTSPGENANEETMKESTQDQRLFLYTKHEKNEIKQDLSQHFEPHDNEESPTTSLKVLNDQGNGYSPTPDYLWKIEKAGQCRAQDRIRDAKKARVSQHLQSSWSPAACNKSPCFVLFQGQQRELCTGCLRVIGLRQMPKVRVCPACKWSFVYKQCEVSLSILCTEL